MEKICKEAGKKREGHVGKKKNACVWPAGKHNTGRVQKLKNLKFGGEKWKGKTKHKNGSRGGKKGADGVRRKGNFC